MMEHLLQGGNLQEELSRLDCSDNDSSALAGAGSLIYHRGGSFIGALHLFLLFGVLQLPAPVSGPRGRGLSALLVQEPQLYLGAQLSTTGLTGAMCILRVGASKQELDTMMQQEPDVVLELLLELTVLAYFVTGSLKTKGATPLK